jgi:WD40 repeat protein
MSATTSPGPPNRGSPKRKRSRSPDSQNGEEDVQLQYAYDEDMGSEEEETFHTPDSATPKKRRIERPTRLNYVPYMTLRGHKRGVAAVKFSPDGRWIASCCWYSWTRGCMYLLIHCSCRCNNQDMERPQRRALSNSGRSSGWHFGNRLEPRLESPRIRLR